MFGGGVDFVNTLLSGTTIASYYPKLTALAPGAMFALTLGVTGMFMFYWAGRDWHKNELLAKKRIVVGLNLVLPCWAILEWLLRFGFEAIKL